MNETVAPGLVTNAAAAQPSGRNPAPGLIVAPESEPGIAGKPAYGDLGVGIGVALMGLIAGWQAYVIPANSLYATIGPAVFAWVAAGLLLLMGLFLVRDALRGGWSSTDEFGEWDELGGVWMILGLVVNLAIIDTMGFIIASTLLFLCTARAFGSTQPLRDVAIGFSLAFVAYLGFDRVLGYKIGSGLIESLL